MDVLLFYVKSHKIWRIEQTKRQASKMLYYQLCFPVFFCVPRLSVLSSQCKRSRDLFTKHDFAYKWHFHGEWHAHCHSSMSPHWMADDCKRQLSWIRKREYEKNRGKSNTKKMWKKTDKKKNNNNNSNNNCKLNCFVCVLSSWRKVFGLYITVRAVARNDVPHLSRSHRFIYIMARRNYVYAICTTNWWDYRGVGRWIRTIGGWSPMPKCVYTRLYVFWCLCKNVCVHSAYCLSTQRHLNRWVGGERIQPHSSPKGKDLFLHRACLYFCNVHTHTFKRIHTHISECVSLFIAYYGNIMQ